MRLPRWPGYDPAVKLLPPIDLDLEALVEQLWRMPGLQAAWLFGSRARGQARPTSDIDVGVLIASAEVPTGLAHFGLGADIASALGLPDGALDLLELRSTSPLIAHRVLVEGRLLVDADPTARVAFQERSLHRFLAARRLREEAAVARAARLRA